MIYAIRRFSDGEIMGQQPAPKKSHALRNTLIGAGTLAAGVMAGKSGLLGTRVAQGVNKAWAKAGKAIGSEGMMLNGAIGYGEASAKRAANVLKKSGKTVNEEWQKKVADKASEKVLMNVSPDVYKKPVSKIAKKVPVPAKAQ